MPHNDRHLAPLLSSRRDFLAAAGLAAGACMAHPLAGWTAQAPKKRPRVAAVFTELRFRSHAYNILENFMGPYLFRGELVDPGVDVVSFYADQFPVDDMARDVSKRFGVPLYKTIGEAVCCGTGRFDVDAVLLIGEHGNYPYNELGQHLYPRKEFFDAVVAEMKRANRFAPVFNDKHLSYRWDWAKEMYDTARECGFPLMAGSSVVLGQRVPPLELPDGVEIEEAIAVHGGGMESYDFHALELLQSFVESRKGGETGISRVEFLSGRAFEAAVRAGRWSQELADAALAAERNANFKRQIRPDYDTNPDTDGPVDAPHPRTIEPKRPSGPHAISLTYKDGLKGTILKIGSDANRWNFACRLKGETKPRATAIFNGPWGNRCLFKGLSHAIQYLFRTGKQPYPIERDLLVCGLLDTALHSYNQQRPLSTPHLEFSYQPIDFRAMRENGDSWKFLTPEKRQPVEFSPGADRDLVGG